MLRQLHQSHETRTSWGESVMMGMYFIAITIGLILYFDLGRYVRRIAAKFNSNNTQQNLPLEQTPNRKKRLRIKQDTTQSEEQPNSHANTQSGESSQNDNSSIRWISKPKLKHEKTTKPTTHAIQYALNMASKPDKKKIREANTKESVKSTTPKVEEKTPKTIQPQKKKKAEKIKHNSDDAEITNLIQQHKSAIQSLYSIYTQELQPDDEEAKHMSSLLAFEKLAKLPTEYAAEAICQDLLLCARVGIDIKSAVEYICNPYFLDSLSKESLSTLLFACFLHDANSIVGNKINPDNTTTLLTQADRLFNELAGFIGEKYSQKIVALQLFSSNNQKYKNKSLKETKYHRYMLDAANYYQSPLTAQTAEYLKTFINLNDESTISLQQEILFSYIKDQLKDVNVTVTLESKISGSSYSADILITNNLSTKLIDVEYDGDTHFYKDMDGKVTTQYKREDIARDAGLSKAGVQVCRFTKHDVVIDYEKKKVIGISQQVEKFIESVKQQRSMNCVASI